MSWQFRQMFPLALVAVVLVGRPAAAQLHVAEPVADAGTIYSGQPLVRKFTLVNAGKLPVEITNAKGSCACAVPRLDKRLYQPGEQGSVELEVHTLGQLAGPNAWGLTLTCKLGEQVTEIPLQIKAELVTEVRCEPAALQMLVREGLTATIAISWKSSLFDKLNAVHSSSQQLIAELLEPGPLCNLGCSSQGIRVAVVKEYPEGRHQEIVSIYTDNPAYRELKVPVTIVKTGHQRVAATPGQVVLSAAAGQPVPSRVVLLRDQENHPVKIEKVTAEHQAISCSWAPGPGTMATLKVRVNQETLPADGLKTTVNVEIAEPVAQTVIVPVEVRRDN